MIVDVSKEFKKGRAQNELLPDQVNRIYNWYLDQADFDGVARLVGIEEIIENDRNLNISRYGEPVIEEETITVKEAIANLKHSLEAAYQDENKLKLLLMESGFLNSEEG